MINITEEAAKEVERILEKEELPDTTFLRLGIKGGGCSGLSYTFAFAESSSLDDVVVEAHGVKLVVDKKSFEFMDGMELGFEKTVMRSGFTFNNPNAARSCGCGTSFSVKI